MTTRSIMGKSLKYYKTGKKLGMECPFCPERVTDDLDTHTRESHPEFWKQYRAYQEAKAWGWPRL